MNFKKFAIGLAIFVLTIVFIVFANKAINPLSKYDGCYSKTGTGYNASSYEESQAHYEECEKEYQILQDKYQENSFIAIIIMSLLAIIAGVLVKAVAPVSWGLVLSGLVMIFYIFGNNIDAIGKPYRAIVTGLALAILIWLAYAKLGDKEKILSSPVN